MALTLEQLFENMRSTTESKEDGNPLKDIFNRAFKSFDGVANSLKNLSEQIKVQNAQNQTARLTGAASDVQSQIRELLQAKIAEDQIESERNKRMMDIAERLVPQVTEEQLKAFRMQQLLFKEHQKTLENTLDIEKKKAEVQKQAAQDMANRQIATIKDKYGTFESAIAGAGNMAQDSLSKYLISGLGRFVKERKEDPQIARANTIAENKKNLADKMLATRTDNIKEDFAIRAAKQHIADPGSASKLYSERDSDVKSLASQGASIEKGLASGKYKFSLPKVEKAMSDVAKAIKGEDTPNIAKADIAEIQEIPEITKDSINKLLDFEPPTVEAKVDAPNPPKTEPTAKIEPNPPKAVPTEKKEPTPKKAPKNAKMQKAPRQSSSLLTPATKRTPQTTRIAPATPMKAGATKNAVKTASVGVKATKTGASVASGARAVGAFGSKAGAINVGAIGSALGSMSAKLGTLASSSLKFLGPWGMVASAVMSFDRLVPIISQGVGAILDITKVIMPLLVSSIIEGFAQGVGALNGLINLLDHAPLFGRKWTESGEVTKAVVSERDKEAQRQTKLSTAKKQAALGGGTLDTTSAVKGVNAGFAQVGKPLVTRQETTLTNPAEAARVSAPPPQEPQQNFSMGDWKQQTEQNQAMREAVIAASNNPGTTPIMVSSPYMEPWPA